VKALQSVVRPTSFTCVYAVCLVSTLFVLCRRGLSRVSSPDFASLNYLSVQQRERVVELCTVEVFLFCIVWQSFSFFFDCDSRRRDASVVSLSVREYCFVRINFLFTAKEVLVEF
jgi:hypothetical protein